MKFLYIVIFKCCFMECSGCPNDYLNGNFPEYCGERVLVSPCQSCCWGVCPNRSNALTNCGGLCGLKDGQPCLVWFFLSSLKIGTSQILVDKLNEARAAWQQKTGQQ
jgi:hypothetical protein